MKRSLPALIAPKKNPVVEERDRIIAYMATLDPTSDEYERARNALLTLTAALGVEKKNKVSGDVIATLAVQGGIMGLVALITKTDILQNWIGRWMPKGRL